MNDKKIILPLLMKLKNKIRFAIGFTLLLMLAVWLIFVFVVDPEYPVSSQLLIEESASTTQHQALEGKRIDSQTMEAYAAFIKSPEVLELVRKNLELKSSISDLQEQVGVSYTSNSPVLTVTVSSESNHQSIEIADTLAFAFQNEVRNSLKADNVTIISQASPQDGSGDSNRNGLMSALIAAAVSGFLLSIFTAIGISAVKAAANAKNRDIRKKEDQLQTVFK